MNTIDDILKNLLKQKEYNFITENEHLKNKIVLLTLGGSYAYGTNTKDSDIDVRGCALNSKSDLLGMSNFEQFIDNETDTVIYSFNKLIHLLTNCNPNVIEILGCKPEYYLIKTDIGQKLLDNRHMFLSQCAIKSFSGYAKHKLDRLMNTLTRNNTVQNQKELQIMNSCLSAMMNFAKDFSEFDEGSIKLYIAKSKKENLETEIMMDVNLQNYPLRDYKNMLSIMNGIVKDYSKINFCNDKKNHKSLDSDASHLLRLHFMCVDILEKQEIITFREKEKDLLLEVKNGKYQTEEGQYRQEFFDILDDCNKRLEYAKKNTSLPLKPNYKLIEDFTMSVNERIVKNEY